MIYRRFFTMEVNFQYEENNYLPIKTISVIGEFNNYDHNNHN